MSEQNENIVILEEPIKRGDTLITQIEIIKPNAGHLRGIGLAALANADVDALTVILPR
ncbi:phage tail assembly protein, partial [Rahnella variigena]